MTPEELTTYLHDHIPLSAAMAVVVESVEASAVRLWAPLAPNINHRDTVFGGSLAAVATLAGWAFVHCGILREGLRGMVVIQSSTINYTAPATTDFHALCLAPEPLVWSRFVQTLRRRGKARLSLTVSLSVDGVSVGSSVAEFVVLGATVVE